MNELKVRVDLPKVEESIVGYRLTQTDVEDLDLEILN